MGLLLLSTSLAFAVGDEWTTLTPSVDDPAARYGHAIARLDDFQSIVLFGGLDATDQALGDTYLFGMASMQWSTATTSGTTPATRAFHTMVEKDWPYPPGVLVYGGEDTAGTPFGDLYQLSYDLQWTLLTPTGGPPPARSHQVAWWMDSKMYIAGGLDGSGTDLLDSWVYDPDQNDWTQLANLPSTVTDASFIGVFGTTAYVTDPDTDDQVLVYDSVGDSWSTASPGGTALPAHRAAVKLAQSGGNRLMGGETWDVGLGQYVTVDGNRELKRVADGWIEWAPMPVGLTYAAGARVPVPPAVKRQASDGVLGASRGASRQTSTFLGAPIVVFGGLDDTGSATANTMLYEPHRNVIQIPWFINTGATGADGFNTWVIFKNVSARTLTLALAYSDDDTWDQVATEPTVVLGPNAVAAHGTRFFWVDTANGTNQGSIVVEWEGVPGESKQEVQGYVNILNNALGYSTGVGFIYPD